jgi:hypothetical protein
MLFTFKYCCYDLAMYFSTLFYPINYELIIGYPIRKFFRIFYEPLADQELGNQP